MSNEITFFIGETDGKFYAVNTSTPCFCLSRDTEEEALEAGQEAWRNYLSFKRNSVVKTSKVVRQTPFESTQKTFIPRQAVFAEAC